METKVEIFHDSFFAMNTRFEALFWGLGYEIGERAFHHIKQELSLLEKTISRYDVHSELYSLNQSAFNQHVEVSLLLWNALRVGVAYRYLTHAYFDISMGNLYQSVKNGQQFENNQHLHIENPIIFNHDDQKIRFSDPNVSVDFGGMGKGLALKTADDILERYGIQNAFVSFGESSVLTRGKHPHGDYWPFALNNSFGIEKEWHLNNSSVSVSQSKIRNHKTAHIINPMSFEPVSEQLTVLVQAQNPIDAEVLSTALIVAPRSEHHKILDNFKVSDVFISNQKPIDR